MDQKLSSSTPQSKPSAEAMMQQIMLMKALGIDQDDRKPVWSDGVMLGWTRNRAGFESSGLLEVRLLPPTMTSPIVQLVLQTNGTISIHPDELGKISKAFGRFNREVPEIFDKVRRDSESMNITRLFLGQTEAGK